MCGRGDERKEYVRACVCARQETKKKSERSAAL